MTSGSQVGGGKDGVLCIDQLVVLRDALTAEQHSCPLISCLRVDFHPAEFGSRPVRATTRRPFWMVGIDGEAESRINR